MRSTSRICFSLRENLTSSVNETVTGAEILGWKKYVIGCEIPLKYMSQVGVSVPFFPADQRASLATSSVRA